MKKLNMHIPYPAILILLAALFAHSACQLNSGEAGGSAKAGYLFNQSPTSLSISKVGTYQDISKPFILPEDEEIHIKSCGEMIVGKPNGKRDVFEMYFDGSNNKGISFDSKDDKFLYFSEQEGSSPNAQVQFYSTSDTSYNIEMAIPYQELKQSGPRESFGFDFAFSDNDNGFEQEKQVAWHSIDSDIWLNSSLWGNLALVKNPGLPNDSTTLSLYTPIAPVIDGRADQCWQKAPPSVTRQVLRGTVLGNNDIKCTLRSLWNNKAIYFLVSVNDNKIIRHSFMGKVFDYGWIEDESGNKVWQANRNNTTHPGGSPKNYCTDTTLKLKAGRYTLHYHSDESHAYNNWDDTPPKDSLYGIIIHSKNIR